MNAILEQWLNNKLGIKLKNKENIGLFLQNGKIITLLLSKYEIIPKIEEKCIYENINQEKYFENLLNLKKYFSLIKINIKDFELFEISEGNNEIAIKFLDEFYVKLESFNKNKSVCKENIKCRKPYSLADSKSIQTNQEIVNKCRGNSVRRNIKNNFDTIVNKYNDRKQCICDVNETAIRYKKCEKLKDIVKEIEKFERIQKNITGNDTSDDEGIYYFDKIVNTPEFNNKQNKIIFDDVEKSIDELKFAENKIYLEKFVEKLIKQSHDEREISEAMHKLNHQQKIFLETDALMYNMSEEERGRNLLKMAEEYDKIVQENILQEQIENERKRKEKELNFRKRLIHDECSHIIEALISLALKYSKFRNINIPNELWVQWKQVFIKDETISEDDSNCDFLLRENSTENLSSIDLDREEILMAADYYDYLHLEREWFTELGPEPIQDTLGYIVTKLLALLHPGQISPKKPHLPDYTVAASLNGIPNYLVSLFKQVFDKYGIVVITPEELINIAVFAYKQESSPENVSEINKTPSKQSKDLSNKSIEKENKSEILSALTKETQTPETLPEPEFAEILSMIELGRLISEKLLLDEKINSNLIVKTLITYLSESNVKGWIVLNFPIEINDLFELESNLKGEFIPLKRNNEYISDMMSYKSELVPYIVNVTKDITFTPYLTHFINVIVEPVLPQTEDMAFICKFYNRNIRFKEFLCGQNVDLDLVEFIIRFILSDVTEESLLSSSNIFEGISLNMFFSKKELQNDKKKQKSSQIFRENQEIEKVLKKPSDWLENWHLDDESIEEENIDIDADLFFKHFVEFKAPIAFLTTLAKIWQSMETRYIRNLKDTFYVKRIENSKILSFGVDVIDLFEQCLRDFNNKQDLVQSFLEEFNKISQIQRTTLEVKTALHSRVLELQTNLWELCDENKKKREETVNLVLNSNSYVHHVKATCNIYMSILNEEIQRFVHTMQLLIDYYTLATKEMPSLNKIDIEPKLLDFTEESSTGINLQNCIEYVDDEGFFVRFEKLKEPLEFVFEHFRHKITDNIPSTQFLNLEENTLKEMNSAIADEDSRISLRIEIIKKKIFHELDQFELWLSTLLNNQFEKLKTRYQNEVTAVNSLAKVLNIAIEEEIPLNQPLYLKEDKVFVGSRDFGLSKQTFSSIKPLTFKEKEFEFSPIQIENLRKIFQNIAPHGMILNNAFVFVVQDLQLNDNYRNWLPEMWMQLSFEKLNRICLEIFGSTSFCDWKDFIILAFEIPFPSVIQLVELSNKFKSYDKRDELIYFDDYLSMQLWFETDLADSPEATLKLIRFKETLFKLFRVDDYRANYSNLLFHLCKDVNPLQGFLKALSVVIGHVINLDIHENFVSYENNFENVYSDASNAVFQLNHISYKTFHKTMAGTFQLGVVNENYLSKDLEECLMFVKSTFESSELIPVQELLKLSCLLTFLNSVNKFKVLSIVDILTQTIKTNP